ncbi:hypothetical protein SNOG_11601 [Parastagonospora nodorum SN15]|uniref:Xylanolytic transcriptional activator regulatory domain-containing protein n=1 Tax=Phaeosphaeria nodorum (strain SN15 / ATCC MYA-4574 / FGSC 10173) TaxID=321614 RepID=Q0U9G3_PHANO|nr:hypothetical protein SNOG_11601 [Parastagonospora nodorum SN15]EAT81309.2 hypothetical protein SNOG_11601 [Parastagonospora nodorum SN15]
MSATSAATGAPAQQHVASPNGTSKLSQPSPDAHSWSDEGSSGEDGVDRSQSGTAGKRKRPLSVSCETQVSTSWCMVHGAEQQLTVVQLQDAQGWCMKNSSACVYLPRKKPGLRAGYGRELEARLDKLENLIVQQQNQIHHLSTNQIAANHSPQEASSYRPSPPILPHTPHVPRPETALFLQKPASTFPSQNALQTQFSARVTDGRPAPSVTGNAYQGQAEEMQQPMTGLHRDSFSSYSEQFTPSMSRSLGQTDADFPPYDLLYALVDLFFKHIYPWCPILHRQTTLNSLFGDQALDEEDRIILHAVVATTVKFSTDPRLTAEKRSRYHSSSKSKVLLYGIENSSVKSLQALVILALDVVGCSNGPPGWNLLALITRSVVQLGLSMEIYSPAVAPQYASIYTLRAIVLPEPKDWIEEESRRRLFWMIYVLDRYATVATAFEFALDENEIDRRLPCRDDLYARNVPVETRWFHTKTRSDYSMNRPENLGTFSYYVEVLGILTKVHKFLKKPVDITSLQDVEQWQREYRELDNAIEEWKYNLPQEFGNSARMFAKAGLNQGLNSGLHVCYWFMAPPSIIASIPPSISLVNTLQELGQYWEVGTRYANLLSRVLSEYQESQQALTGINGERVTPSTVKILADMRRCAFDLDFLISRQPKLNSNARLPSVTPARTPAPNELEYLDVFDFFNMPRLPVSMDATMSYTAGEGMQIPEGAYENESNITNYMVDASSDWFMKQASS